MTKAPERRTRVLAVASGGGHWVQLLRLRPALAYYDRAYVTVDRAYQQTVGDDRFYVVTDATRWNKFKLMWMVAQIAWVLMRERPDVIISTGAAPGYVAIRLGKWMGARTLWLDSIANVEQLSMSGQKLRGFADLWLTQWPHLAQPDGPTHAGTVLGELPSSNDDAPPAADEAPASTGEALVNTGHEQRTT